MIAFSKAAYLNELVQGSQLCPASPFSKGSLDNLKRLDESQVSLHHFQTSLFVRNARNG